jgi:isoprenylcysteine carboxyl methyltransferase (ICMT) family protein YpbQ
MKQMFQRQWSLGRRNRIDIHQTYINDLVGGVSDDRRAHALSQKHFSLFVFSMMMMMMAAVTFGTFQNTKIY